MVSRRPTHRLREPRLGRPRHLEKQGARLKERTEAKTSAQIWDGGPIYFWDTWLDDRQMHVFSVGIEGGEPVNLTAGTGLELPRAAVQLRRPLFDISPDGKELAFIADTDPAVNATNLDVYTVALGGKDATQPQREQSGGRRRAAVQPGRPLARLRPAAHPRLLRRPAAG